MTTEQVTKARELLKNKAASSMEDLTGEEVMAIVYQVQNYKGCSEDVKVFILKEFLNNRASVYFILDGIVNSWSSDYMGDM